MQYFVICECELIAQQSAKTAHNARAIIADPGCYTNSDTRNRISACDLRSVPLQAPRKALNSLCGHAHMLPIQWYDNIRASRFA